MGKTECPLCWRWIPRSSTGRVRRHKCKPKPASEKANTQKRGRCTECGRVVLLRRTGAVRRHYAGLPLCPGSDRKPARRKAVPVLVGRCRRCPHKEAMGDRLKLRRHKVKSGEYCPGGQLDPRLSIEKRVEEDL